jgi:hypothetical protein
MLCKGQDANIDQPRAGPCNDGQERLPEGLCGFAPLDLRSVKPPALPGAGDSGLDGISPYQSETGPAGPRAAHFGGAQSLVP